MIDAPWIPWLRRLRRGVEKVEQRFMPSFLVSGVSLGSCRCIGSEGLLCAQFPIRSSGSFEEAVRPHRPKNQVYVIVFNLLLQNATSFEFLATSTEASLISAQFSKTMIRFERVGVVGGLKIASPRL